MGSRRQLMCAFMLVAASLWAVPAHGAVPIATDDAVTVFEDAGPTVVDVLANDSDPDNDPMTIAGVTQPANGEVSISNGGADVTYESSPDYCNDPVGSPDTFTYSLQGGSTATVTVTVTCVDDPPAATADVVNVTEDTAKQLDLRTNDDFDGGADELILSVTQPAHGTVSITNAGADVAYQPAPNYCTTQPGGSPDGFSYTLTGGSSADVTVTVTCVDDPPSAVDDEISTAEDGPVEFDPRLNDDIDGGPFDLISAVTQPAHGVASVSNQSTRVTYVPEPNYCNDPPGTPLDAFDYSLAGGTSATVTVTVTCVVDQPVATNDSIIIPEGVGATPLGVLANDQDVDDIAVISSVSDALDGAAAILEDGSDLTYSPDYKYCNTQAGGEPEVLDYTLTNGTSASVTITISCFADVVGIVSPFAGVEGQIGEQDGPRESATFESILAMDSDGENLYLSVYDDPGNSGDPPHGWIRKIDMSTGEVTTLLEGAFGFSDFVHADGSLYLANGLENKIQRLDLSDPTPELVDFGPAPLRFPGSITTDGESLFISEHGHAPCCVDPDPPARIQKIPLADPDAMSILVELPAADEFDGMNVISDMDEDAGYIYASSKMYVWKIDTSTGSIDRLVNGINTNGMDVLSYSSGLEVVDGIIFLAFSHEIWAIDPITGVRFEEFAGDNCLNHFCGVPPQTPQMGKGVDVSWHPSTIATHGGRLYVADRLEHGVGPCCHISHLIRRVEVLPDGLPPIGSAEATSPPPAFAASGASTPTTASEICQAQNENERCVPLSLSAVDQKTAHDESGVRWFQVRSSGKSSEWTLYSPSSTVKIYDEAGRIRFRDRAFNVSAWSDIDLGYAVAVDDAFTVDEDSPPTAFDVLANDADPNSNGTIVSVTQPTDGLVVKSEDGSALTYTPDADYCNSNGTPDGFTYELLGGSVGAVSVTVTCIDDPGPPPDPTSTLTLRYSVARRRVSGKLSTPEATECDAARTVTIYRVRASGNAPIANVDTSATGTYRLKKRLRPGKYRASVSAETIGATNCQAVTSRTLRVR